MANKIYQEKQRYQDWLVISMLAAATLALLYGAASYLWSDGASVVYSGICLLLAAGLGYAIWWLRSLRSNLTVTDKTIKFKITGAVESSKKIAWKDIVACTPVMTPKLAKYDRLKVTLTDEKFYSLNGRRGILIETKNGEHFFIGCQNLGELQEALDREDILWRATI